MVVGGVKTDADGGGEGGGAVATTPSSQQQQQQQPPQVPAPMGMGGYGYQPPPGSMRAPAGVGGGAFPFPPQVMMPYGGAMGGGGYPPMMYPPPYAATAAYANPGMMMSSMMSSAAAAAAAVAALPKKLEVGTTTTITTTQICTIHPPGMPRAFDVPFPPRKLPVCVRCKKNYRSRELCRQRDEHRALPWQTTYIIVTLTEAVLEKREDGTQCIADIPVAAVLQDMPDMCRGPADGFMTKQPICKLCKDKNYTRDYCRTSSKHTTPPYQTVYIKLVPKSMADEDPLLMSMRQSKKKKRKAEEHCDGKPTPNLVIGKQGDDYLVVKEEEEGSDSDDAEEDKGDDLTQIHPSKTFFAEISAKKITVKVCVEILLGDVQMYLRRSESTSHVFSFPLLPFTVVRTNSVPRRGSRKHSQHAHAPISGKQYPHDGILSVVSLQPLHEQLHGRDQHHAPSHARTNVGGIPCGSHVGSNKWRDDATSSSGSHAPNELCSSRFYEKWRKTCLIN